MFIVEIKKQDGELYWKEVFNDKATAEKWLETEKTRPYWKKYFDAKVIEEAPQVAILTNADEKKVKDAFKSLVKKLKDLGLNKAEIKLLLGADDE